MKLFIFTFLFTLTSAAFSQVIIDKNIARKFNAAYTKLDPLVRQKLEKEPSFANSIRIFTVNKIDTLNKDELIPNGRTILLKDANGNTVTNNNEDVTNQPFPFMGTIYNDSLVLHDIWGVDKYTIFKCKLTATYEVFQKGDSIYRLHLADQKVSSLFIPINSSKFVLNTSTFAEGKTMYGEIVFVTQTFYEEDTFFKNNYIKTRLRCSFVFRIIPKKNNNRPG
ncbi:MAG: hypothetical protein ABIW38_14185 [Ferruginibacter sp.]